MALAALESSKAARVHVAPIPPYGCLRIVTSRLGIELKVVRVGYPLHAASQTVGISFTVKACIVSGRPTAAYP